MKKDKKNVHYKKITVEIPYTTYLSMDCYCTGNNIPGKKYLYYCDFINIAILEYIDKHL